MLSRRVIYDLGFFILLICGSSLALGQGVPQIVSASNGQTSDVVSYPLYFLLNTSGTYSGIAPSNITFKELQNTGTTTNMQPAWKYQFYRCLCSQFNWTGSPFTDVATTYGYTESTSTSYFADNVLLVDSGYTLPIVSGNTPSRYYSQCFFYVPLRGVVYFRKTPTEYVYDFFVYIYTYPAVSSGSAGDSVFVCSRIDDSYSVWVNQARGRASSNVTRQWVAQFTARISVTDFEIVSSSSYSLPFRLSANNIDFALNGMQNYYYNSYGSTNNTATDYPTFSGYDFREIATGSTYWPLETNYYIRTASNVNAPIRVQDYLDSNRLEYLDTDNGGMTDFCEWYQTQHDVLDAEDDDTDSTSPDDPDPELPEPEEGEKTVDIGKDTQERYKQYWDEQTGDENELPTIQTPEIENQETFEFGAFDVESLSRRAKSTADSALEDSTVGSNFGSTFSPFDSDDSEFNLSFQPTASFPSLNSTIALNPIDLNPAHILGMGQRSETTYGSVFKLFRYALFVVEVLVFSYSCLKLVLNQLAPSGGSSSDDGGET